MMHLRLLSSEALLGFRSRRNLCMSTQLPLFPDEPRVLPRLTQGVPPWTALWNTLLNVRVDYQLWILRQIVVDKDGPAFERETFVEGVKTAFLVVSRHINERRPAPIYELFDECNAPPLPQGAKLKIFERLQDRVAVLSESTRALFDLGDNDIAAVTIDRFGFRKLHKPLPELPDAGQLVVYTNLVIEPKKRSSEDSAASPLTANIIFTRLIKPGNFNEHGWKIGAFNVFYTQRSQAH